MKWQWVFCSTAAIAACCDVLYWLLRAANRLAGRAQLSNSDGGTGWDGGCSSACSRLRGRLAALHNACNPRPQLLRLCASTVRVTSVAHRVYTQLGTPMEAPGTGALQELPTGLLGHATWCAAGAASPAGPGRCLQ